MKIDSFLHTYNANSALFDRVANNVSSFDAAKNYARAEFGSILDEVLKKDSENLGVNSKEFGKNNENLGLNSSEIQKNGENLGANSSENSANSEILDRNLANFRANGVLNGARVRYKDERAYDAALREQTDAFEAFFIKSILDVSLSNKVSLFGEDASDEIYRSMYNDAMSRALSGGLGFSELLFNYLKERS